MDAGLEVYPGESGDVRVLRVAGAVDLAKAPELRERLALIPADSGTVIIDMSQVSFLDSTGLSVLVASWKRFSGEDDHGKFRVVASRPAIQRVFHVTGLTHVLRVFPTLEEAIKA